MTPEQLAEAESALGLRVAKLATAGMNVGDLQHVRTQALLKLLLGPERLHEANEAMHADTAAVVEQLEAMQSRSRLLTNGRTPPPPPQR